MKNKNFLFLSPLLIAFFSVITYWIGYNQHKKNNDVFIKWEAIDKKIGLKKIYDYEKLLYILSTIEEKYVDSVSTKNLLELSIKNILKNLDPHSQYMPYETSKASTEILDGHFGGVGIRFMIIRDSLVVINAIKGGPSYIAGIKKRDRIIEVNGKNIASIGLKNADVLKLLKGEIESSVSLTIFSPETNTKKEIKINRGIIPLNSISASLLLNSKIGYIKLTSFSNKSEIEIIQAIESLKKDGMEKLILDLRFNGGGYLHAAQGVANQFLDKNQLIVYTEGVNSQKKEFYANEDGVFKDGELVVLVNSLSASASEIVCGALQDHKRAQIMGRRTFGKGLVQEPITLSDKSEFRITTSRYYTPSGKCIQKPYGKNVNYDNDIYQRMDNGELTTNVFLKDSTKNKQYGEGGIIPDIFIPIDTSTSTISFNEFLYTPTLRDFCFDYYEKNQEKDYSVFDNITNYNKNFFVNDKMVQSLLLNTETIKMENLSKGEIEELKWRIKGEIASYYFNDNSKYLIYSFEDLDISTAIKHISNTK